MKKPMNQRVRRAIIAFLVEQEEPETPQLAKEIEAMRWEVSDEELIKANNYNQVRKLRQLAAS